ncbi:MAG: GH3 auxin-responsive promoter family protein [Polyangiaceae bacterium]
MSKGLSFLHALGQLQRLPHQRRFERSIQAPARAQAERLRNIAELSATTAFGREHDLRSVRTLADLQRRVPVQNANTMRPWIEREMKGERKALCAEAPIFYAVSSGTMGEPKITPTTESFRREFQTSLLTSMAYTYQRHRPAFTGSILYFVARKELSRAPDGTPIGFTSGFNFSRMPKLVQRAYAVPYAAFEVENARARAYLTTWLSALSDVTVIGAIFPLALSELLRATEGDADALVRDLERGTLRDDIVLTGAERHHFEKFARRDARRAEHVARVSREEGGKLTGRAIFPKARLLYCWAGASAGQHIRALREKLPEGLAVSDGVYAANEGWSNVPLADGEIGGPVSIHGHFYEFVEEGDWENGKREGCGVEELVSGKSYRLLLSTSAGLLRYDLGDIIHCSGHFGRTPRIAFERRSGASYNLTGEKLNEAQVQRAVSTVGNELRMTPTFFSAVPCFEPRPRWELWVEFSKEHSTEELMQWRTRLDAIMREQLSDYKLYRGGALGPIALRVLRPGAYGTWRNARGAHAQSKVVNLETRPEAFEGLVVERWIVDPEERR